MYTSKGHYSIIWNKKIVAQNKKSNQIVYDIDLFNDYVLTKVLKFWKSDLILEFSMWKGSKA